MSEKCQYCDESFSTSQQLGVHLNTDHKYVCWYTLCDKSCSDKLALQKHQCQKHNLRYPCAICWRAFNTAAELAHHLDEPSDRSSCNLCQKDVGSGEVLWLHTYKLHKNYCPLGGKRCIKFASRDEFDEHVVLRHHLYCCQYCHLVFRSDETKKEHVGKVHEVAFGKCDRVFVSEDDVDAHAYKNKCFVC